MATFKPNEPISTTTSQIQVENVRPGVHKFQLVVEDEAGNRSKPETATVTVIATSNLVTVPTVVNLLAEDAERVLATVNLAMEISDFIVSPTVGARLVLRQTPAAGTRAAIDSIVRVVISSTGTVKVPPLIDKPLTEALKILRDLGFQFTITGQTGNTAQGFVVVRQLPAAGQNAQLKSVVQLFVNRRP